ncbi:uncharacterized protein LOC110033012 [Phalaenopsis equestris]|uniref:uncharacterized protein LOC110033012 n=1 Tax=Phalaenopsis equestris TaxID=78828 RepID=UPI0009E2BE7D|nr:uncharacterized protein LOC110033012 [Phalaenopsis equestris]
MEGMKSWQIPAFGNCDERFITQYYKSASQGRARFVDEEDLFEVPVAMPVKYGNPYGGHCRRKVKSGNEDGAEKQHIKQGRGFGAAAGTLRRRNAVDEDLYKIPPEFLHQKPMRKKPLRSLLSGCMSLNCIR